VLTASAYGNRFLFQGRDRDPDTGLYNFRYRTYSPTLGRFLQVDPIGQEGGLHLYRFVLNSPQVYDDPYGQGPALYVLAGVVVGLGTYLAYLVWNAGCERAEQRTCVDVCGEGKVKKATHIIATFGINSKAINVGITRPCGWECECCE
jgi:RHS repeat-associated protein